MIDIVTASNPEGLPVRTFDGVVILATGPGVGGLGSLFDEHTEMISWDGRDESGALVPDGFYLLIATVDLVEVRRNTGATTTRASAGPETSPVEVDNSAPTVVIDSPGPGEAVGTLAIPVAGAALGGDVVSVLVAGVPALLAPDGTFLGYTELGEGPAVIEVVATDDVGNVGAAAVSIIVDVTPPVVVFEPLADGLFTRLNPLTLTGFVDDLTAVDLTVDGNLAEILPGPAPVRFEVDVPLGPGENLLWVLATDAAGNSTSFDIHVTLDTTPPVILSVEIEEHVLFWHPSLPPVLVVPQPSVDTPQPSLAISYADDLSGIFTQGVQVLVNGANIVSSLTVTETGVTGDVPLALPGLNTLHLIVPDRTGNRVLEAFEFVVEIDVIAEIFDPTDSADGAVIFVPAGSLDPSLLPDVSIETFAPFDPRFEPGTIATPGVVIAGPLIDVRPTGAVFAFKKPGVITLPYDPTVLASPGSFAGYVPEELLRVYQLLNPEEAFLDLALPVYDLVDAPLILDPQANLLTVLVPHLSVFFVTTSDDPPYSATLPAVLVNEGSTAEEDQTLELLDLESMTLMAAPIRIEGPQIVPPPPPGQVAEPDPGVWDLRLVDVAPDSSRILAIGKTPSLWGAFDMVPSVPGPVGNPVDTLFEIDTESRLVLRRWQLSWSLPSGAAAITFTIDDAIFSSDGTVIYAATPAGIHRLADFVEYLGTGVNDACRAGPPCSDDDGGAAAPALPGVASNVGTRLAVSPAGSEQLILMTRGVSLPPEAETDSVAYASAFLTSLSPDNTGAITHATGPLGFPVGFRPDSYTEWTWAEVASALRPGSCEFVAISPSGWVSPTVPFPAADPFLDGTCPELIGTEPRERLRHVLGKISDSVFAMSMTNSVFEAMLEAGQIGILRDDGMALSIADSISPQALAQGPPELELAGLPGLPSVDDFGVFFSDFSAGLRVRPNGDVILKSVYAQVLASAAGDEASVYRYVPVVQQLGSLDPAGTFVPFPDRILGFVGNDVSFIENTLAPSSLALPGANAFAISAAAELIGRGLDDAYLLHSTVLPNLVTLALFPPYAAAVADATVLTGPVVPIGLTSLDSTPPESFVFLYDHTSGTVRSGPEEVFDATNSGVSFNSARPTHSVLATPEPGSAVPAALFPLAPPLSSSTNARRTNADTVSVTIGFDANGDGLNDGSLANLETATGLDLGVRVFLSEDSTFTTLPGIAPPVEVRQPEVFPGSEIHIFAEPSGLEFFQIDPVTGAETPGLPSGVSATEEADGHITLDGFNITGSGSDGAREVFWSLTSKDMSSCRS